MQDRDVACGVCKEMFVFTVEEQLEALRTVPLDDLLDPPGKEQGRWILPPSECPECLLRLAERI